MRRGITALALLAMLIASSAALADDTPASGSTDSTQPTESTEPAKPVEDTGGTAGNVQFLFGQTYLPDFWRPLDEPMSFGIEVDFAPKTSPVHVAFAWHAFAETEHVDLPYFDRTGSVGDGFAEVSVGFLWLPVKHGVVRPYIGGGGLTMVAAVGGGSDWWNGDRDYSFGFYGNAGVFFKVGNVFHLGFDGRIVRGTNISLAGRNGDADYEQVNMLMGFSWGH